MIGARTEAFERIAAAAIVLAAGACMVTAFAGLNRATPAFAGSVHVDAKDAVVRVVRDGTTLARFPDDLEFGDSLTVVSGRPVLRVPGGTVELGPGGVAQVQLPLKIDHADAIARGKGLALDLNGVLVQVDGVVRIERGYATQISVLSGLALVRSGRRFLSVAAMSEVIVPGVGLLPSSAQPIDATSATIATASLSAPVPGEGASTPARAVYPVPPSGQSPGPNIVEAPPVVAPPASVSPAESDPLAPVLGDGEESRGLLGVLLGGVLGD